MDVLFALVLINSTMTYTVNSIDFQGNSLSSYKLENATHLEKGCFVYNNDDLVYSVLNIYQDSSALSIFSKTGNQISRYYYTNAIADNIQFDQLELNYYTTEYDMTQQINTINKVNPIDGTKTTVGKIDDVVEVCMSTYNQKDGIYFLAIDRDMLVYNTSSNDNDYKRIDLGSSITSMTWNAVRNLLYVWVHGPDSISQVLLEVNIDTRVYSEVLIINRVVSNDGVSAIDCEGDTIYSSMYDVDTLNSLWIVTDLKTRSSTITRLAKNLDIIGLSYNCLWVK